MGLRTPCKKPALFANRHCSSGDGWWKQYGLLDESLNYCMDYEYWLRLGKAGVRFGYLKKNWPVPGSMLTTRHLGARVKVHKEINDMFKKLFGKVPDRWLFNYAHAVVESKTVRKESPRWFVIKLLVSTVRRSLALEWEDFGTDMKTNLIQWGKAAFLRG